MSAKKLAEDMLDDIYFSLPIEWGQGLNRARALGISPCLLLKGLRMLMAEELVIHPRIGFYVEDLGFDEASL